MGRSLGLNSVENKNVSGWKMSLSIIIDVEISRHLATEFFLRFYQPFVHYKFNFHV